jgi:hypothetical protein
MAEEMMRRSTLKPSTTPMKRSAFKPRFAKSNALTVPVRKPMKSHGKKRPTAEESAWMAFVAGFGCVVCWNDHGQRTPCDVHHIVEGGRRLGHLWTIGLCPGHHRNNEPGKLARHVNKSRFEATYGDEYELHAYLLTQYELKRLGQ